MKINGFEYTDSEVQDALKKRGYLLLSWVWKFEDETFPGGKEVVERRTKVALKSADMPCEENIWTNVARREFQREITKPPLA